MRSLEKQGIVIETAEICDLTLEKSEERRHGKIEREVEKSVGESSALLPENTSYKSPNETIGIVTEVITDAIVEVVIETIEDLLSSADVIKSVSVYAGENATAYVTENASAYAAENAGKNVSANAAENASAYAGENASAYAAENAGENASANAAKNASAYTSENATAYADVRCYTEDSCRCTAPQSWRTAISRYVKK
jgi:hypothetical protein